MTIDFSLLSPILSKTFDTDLIDIYRRTTTTGDNDIDIETEESMPIYTDVPCSIEYNETDNPDLANNPTQPIIMSLRVYASRDIDVQSGDLITARKCDTSGTVLKMYEGTAAEPTRYQSRAEIIVGIKRNV